MEEKKREQNVVNGKILEGNKEVIRNIKEDAVKKIKFSKEKKKRKFGKNYEKENEWILEKQRQNRRIQKLKGSKIKHKWRKIIHKKEGKIKVKKKSCTRNKKRNERKKSRKEK